MSADVQPRLRPADANDSIIEVPSDDRVPLFMIGAVLLRNRWRIARWMLSVGIIAVLPVIARPVSYRASTSFIPQGSAGQNRIAGLAGQFGISFNSPSGDESLSPEFYVTLLHSRVLLLPIVRDSFTVPEVASAPRPLMDLLNIPTDEVTRREEHAVRTLSDMITTNSVKSTGVVEVSVQASQRSLALGIATALLDAVEDYNRLVRKRQSGAERAFVESRLKVARRELAAAEEDLGKFLRTNRTIGSSPELAMTRERLDREVNLKQQIVTSLAQAHEDARIREVRDIPVITVFEPPYAPARAEPRGRVRRALFGMMLGGFAGMLVTLGSAFVTNRRAAGDGDVTEFVRALADIKREASRPLHWAARIAGGRKLGRHG